MVKTQTIKEEIVKDEIESEVKKEPMIPISDVKKLIAEALAKQGQVEEPDKPTEYRASLCRLDSKWVVGFKDYNSDPYITSKQESIKKWNAESRESISYVTLIFDDGSEKEMPINLFMRYATPLSCMIIERKKKDRSYSTGKVERMEWSGDRKRGTGEMVDQKVTIKEESFVIETPDGKQVEVPASVINLIQAPNTKKY